MSTSMSPSQSPSVSPSNSPSESPSTSPTASPSEGYENPRFVLVDSPYIVASGEITTAQLTAPAGKTTADFQAGRIQDDENPTDVIDLAVGKYTEIEWCIKATEYAEVDATYQFRVTKYVEWVPTDITNCILWLRSDLGITKDGSDRVDTWADQSENGHDATQATDAAKPVWQANIINTTLPAIYFDGADDNFSCNGVASHLSGNDTPFTHFVVFKNVDVLNRPRILYVTNAAWSQTIDIWTHVDEKGGFQKYPVAAHYTVTTQPPSIWYIRTDRHPGTTISMWKNATLVMDAEADDAASFTLTKAVIGAMTNGNGERYYFFKGWMVEEILYDSALSEGDRTLVLDYLNTRYAIY